MPMAEQMKSAVGFSAPGQNRNAIAIGTNKTSPVSDGFNFTMNSGWIADTKIRIGSATCACCLSKRRLAAQRKYRRWRKQRAQSHSNCANAAMSLTSRAAINGMFFDPVANDD
jgi:hypothetical protein